MFSLIGILEKTLEKLPQRANQPRHLAMGERGERAALFYLRHAGYVVVARRWTTHHQRGDIDLIAWEGDTLCFVEVKSRSSHAIASAESSIDEDKRKTLRHIAFQYQKSVQPPAGSMRFDVVSVYFENSKPELILYRNAFEW